MNNIITYRIVHSYNKRQTKIVKVSKYDDDGIHDFQDVGYKATINIDAMCEIYNYLFIMELNKEW